MRPQTALRQSLKVGAGDDVLDGVEVLLAFQRQQRAILGLPDGDLLAHAVGQVAEAPAAR